MYTVVANPDLTQREHCMDIQSALVCAIASLTHGWYQLCTMTDMMHGDCHQFESMKHYRCTRNRFSRIKYSSKNDHNVILRQRQVAKIYVVRPAGSPER